MFGVTKLKVAGIDPDDLNRLAVIVAAVAGWRSEGSSKERLALGRLEHTTQAILGDLERGKTPDLTIGTIGDLQKVAVFFSEEIDGVLDRQAPRTFDPGGAYAAGAKLKDASLRIAAGLDRILAEGR